MRRSPVLSLPLQLVFPALTDIPRGVKGTTLMYINIKASNKTIFRGYVKVASHVNGLLRKSEIFI